MEIRLTGVILTKNEEDNISNCLDNLKFCNEIIVVDDNSEDETLSIAKKNGAKVYKRELQEDFAAQRNFGLEKASGRWVLFIDPDEEVTEELKSEILNVINDPANINTGFYLKRKDILYGKKLKHGEWGEKKLLRFGRRTAGKWKRKVHETWDISGKVAILSSPLLHKPHPTLRDFVNSVNKFSTLHAKANFEEGKRSSILKIIILPPLKFINNHIFKLGFLDGVVGFVYSMMMSLHSFLAWSKLWMMQKTKLSED